MLTKDDNGDGFRLQLKIQLDGSFRRSVIAASEVAEMTHAGIVKHCCEVFQDALPPGCLPTIKFQDDEGDFCDLLPTTTSVADLLSCAVRVEGQPDLRRLQLVLAVAAGSGAGSVASAAAAAAAVSDSAAIAALVDSVSGNQASVAAEVPSAPVATPDAVGPSTSTAVAAETEDNNKISSTSPISTSTAAAAVDPRTIAPRKVANTGPMLPKGFIAESKPLNEEQLEKMRYEHFAGSGRRKRWQAREVPLTDDELECWLEQSRWLTCSVTGKRWLGSKSIIGVGLYHAPRFLSDEERERQAETSRFVQQRDSAARAVQASRPITSTALADDDIDSTEELFHAPPPANIKPFASASAPSIDTRVGSLDVIVGPVFDIDAFNDGAIGNPAKGILPYDQRGVVDMDRQFNALNMAYYVAKGKSIGTAQRYERKMITNRLSFYIEEFHGRKVFPDNVEAQLALLVHRDADAFDKCVYPVTRDDMIADAVKRCIPKILKATVASMLSDKNEADSDRFDQALRVYLLVHQMAIKLVVRYSGVYSYLFRSVLQWIQNPFTAKSRVRELCIRVRPSRIL
ncbi:hypothetical protein CAOG_009952 [Capsaspora owczarzaki ATCC 30864]|uniref:Uncharacterized protein n=1 Tax=Capsaspora owczarzaki (strain ATCC 30864) TaxID=595528 RepID=A0A0D2WUN1_CAPO3|nr:hypothetical protein CAOG_009952 [Capsaspora owczarzaki ATCC 30864]